MKPPHQLHASFQISWEELKRLAHIAREHADHEYVAPLEKMTGGRKKDVVCKSFEQMQKVIRTEEKILAAEAEAKQNVERAKKISGKNQPKKVVPKRTNILTLDQIKERARKKDKEAKEKYKDRMKQVKKKAAMKKSIQSGRLSDPYARNQLLLSAKMNSLMWARQSAKRRQRDDDAPSSDDDVLDSIYRDGTDSEDAEDSESSSEDDSNLDYDDVMGRSPPRSPQKKAYPSAKDEGVRKTRTPRNAREVTHRSEENYRDFGNGDDKIDDDDNDDDDEDSDHDNNEDDMENDRDDCRHSRHSSRSSRSRLRDSHDDDVDRDDRHTRDSRHKSHDYDDEDDENDRDSRDTDDSRQQDEEDSDDDDLSSADDDRENEFDDTRDYDDDAVASASNDTCDEEGEDSKPTKYRCLQGAECKNMHGMHRREVAHPGDADWETAKEHVMVVCANCGKTVKKLMFCSGCTRRL